MKNLQSIRKLSMPKTEEGEMKKVPKKKDYKGPKRIRGSFRILRDEDIEGEIDMSDDTEVN